MRKVKYLMKILKVSIYSPDKKLLREVNFKENGLSVIYGDVEKPKSESETSNSIGKTILLKIINVVYGAKNSGKDTIKGLDKYMVNATVKNNDIKYEVELTIGDSRGYYINGMKYNLAKYKEILKINRSYFNKQTMLEKRKGLLSNIAKKANKDDISVVLKLLYLDDIENIFIKIKKKQDEIELINKYNKSFKEDATELEKEKFSNEMKRKQIDEELRIINERIKTLKVSENISEISQKRASLDEKIKRQNEKLKLNNIKISNYEQVIRDSHEKNISLSDVEKIYSVAKVEIPELLKKELSEIEKFYQELFDDKNSIYAKQILELKDKNEKILKELVEEKRRLDELSEVISENDAVREAIKIYDLKTKEKINIESKISEIDAQLSQVNSSKDLKIQINTLLNELDQLFGEKNAKINLYREFVYNLVTKIYGEDRNPYLNIGPTESKQKYKAMPISIDLSFDGDTGEGLTSAKYLIFDFLIMNYTKYVDFLIEDSSCFESIDRRQIVNLILEGKKISHLTNKQFIISLNKYLLDDNDIIKDDIVISLSENDTLLNIKF